MNIADANDAYLGSKARFETWKTRYMQTWFAPQISLMMALAIEKLKLLPPEVQSELQQRSPNAWAELMKGGRNGRL